MDSNYTELASEASSDRDIVILAVEDDEDNQLLLEHAITMFGWKYIFATDAVTAISLAKEQQPDLILLDIVLPQISGLQIAMMLKSNKRTRDIPLIAVTGLAKKPEQLLFAAGFDDYIYKPYNLIDLQQAIASNLNHADYCEIT
ncbi:response regulator [Pleurocapsales cyanobacterium LEGE 10410]|nr:response regulator [Pleurocapsales cyanobacterium LEGE 10410]